MLTGFPLKALFRYFSSSVSFSPWRILRIPHVQLLRLADVQSRGFSAAPVQLGQLFVGGHPHPVGEEEHDDADEVAGEGEAEADVVVPELGRRRDVPPDDDGDVLEESHPEVDGKEDGRPDPQLLGEVDVVVGDAEEEDEPGEDDGDCLGRLLATLDLSSFWIIINKYSQTSI